MTTDTLSKIKKLLTLANDAGATEGEAQAALRRVAALAAKYNISDVEINKAVRADGSEGVTITVDQKDLVEQNLHVATKISRWDGRIAMAIGVATNTGIYRGYSNYDAALKIYGLPQDVAVAVALFTFARGALAKNVRGWTRIEKLRRPWIKSGGVEQRTYKDGFVLGLWEAANEKLAPEKAEVALGATTALVLTTDIQKAKTDALAIKSRALGLGKGRRSRTMSSGRSDHDQGRSDGRRTDLGSARLA